MERPARTRWYPVVLDLSGRKCLVVGGGEVAARKVRDLLECGADVTVVAPDVDPGIESSGARLERRPYGSPEAGAGGYRFVVTATGRPEVDGAVAADAEAAGVWVNSADDPDRCTAILPSVHRDGPVTVSVSTGGSSPALAAWLRRDIAASLPGGLGALAGALADGRGRLRAAGRSTADVDFGALLRGPVGERLRAGDLDGARRVIGEAIDAALARPGA